MNETLIIFFKFIFHLLQDALNTGQSKFKQWLEDNADDLKFERRRVAQQATDALRLQQLRKEREDKKKREQEEIEKNKREEMRRQPLDPEAAGEYFLLFYLHTVYTYS